MGKQKKIAEAPDGMEYIWAVDPVKGMNVLAKKSPILSGFILPSTEGARYYDFFGLRLERTDKTYTHEGRRCIFVDMPVFEVEAQGGAG